MSRVISYSLFGDPSSFEFGYYLRGVYFNVRMNRILYPDFVTWINLDLDVYTEYEDLFLEMNQLLGLKFYTLKHEQRCKSMLWRMKPMFFEIDAEYVLCRDLDSVPTYREANCVYDWIKSGLPFHAINDNDAHAGLMGGLVGFRTEDFKRDTGYYGFDEMIKGQDLRQHGSDQNFMNKYIHPKIKKGLLMHKLKGAGIDAARVETKQPVGYLNSKLWVSDLISRYIGSAGVIDFELIRFFQSFDKNQKFDDFERKYSDICYWRK